MQKYFDSEGLKSVSEVITENQFAGYWKCHTIFGLDHLQNSWLGIYIQTLMKLVSDFIKLVTWLFLIW